MRHWVKQAEVDQGRRPGVTTEDRQRIVELEKENRELRRANEILKAGFSKRTVEKTHAVLHRALDQAMHWGLTGQDAMRPSWSVPRVRRGAR